MCGVMNTFQEGNRIWHRKYFGDAVISQWCVWRLLKSKCICSEGHRAAHLSFPTQHGSPVACSTKCYRTTFLKSSLATFPFPHVARDKTLLCQRPQTWRWCFYFFIFKIFIYLVAPGLSCSRRAPSLRLQGSLVAAGVLLSCGTWTLSCGTHVGSSSLTRDQTWSPCIGSAESYPLRHQGSPDDIFKKFWGSPWCLPPII